MQKKRMSVIALQTRLRLSRFIRTQVQFQLGRSFNTKSKAILGGHSYYNDEQKNNYTNNFLRILWLSMISATAIKVYRSLVILMFPLL